MSVQAALDFISGLRESVRNDTRLAGKYAAYGIGEFVVLGRERGFKFDAAELREAHALDWGMRLNWLDHHRAGS